MSREQLVSEEFRESLLPLRVVAAGLAHDFNNLISGILQIASLTKAKGEFISQGDSVSYLDYVERLCGQASNLTGRVLSFSQPGDGQRKVIVAELIEDALSLFFSGSNFRYDVDIPENLWDIDLDVENFQYFLLKLSMRVRNFMTNGGTFIVRAENEYRTVPDREKLSGGSSRYVKFTFEVKDAYDSYEILFKVFELSGPIRSLLTNRKMAIVHCFEKEGSFLQVYFPAMGNIPGIPPWAGSG